VLATIPVTDTYAEATCTDQVPALWNAADVTSGSFPDDARACGFIPQVPTPSVAKTVASTVQNADGTWTVVYQVDVTNPSDDLATQYDLTDTLAYGAGITVNSASVTGPGAQADWDGAGQITVAAGEFLAAGATASYTVTVNATVTTEATADDRTCQPQGPGGFRNDSHVGLAAPAQPQPEPLRGSSGALLAAPDAQGSQDATACSEPVSPELAKTFVSAMQHAGADGSWDGTWDVTYTVTVSNPSSTTGLSYDLSDTPGFPSDVVVNGGTVSGTDSGGDPITVLAGWSGTDHAQIVTGRALPAGGTDTYTVVVNATVPSTISTDAATCSETGAQHGFFNAAEAISGEDHFPAQDCGNIPQLPTPTVAKTVTSLSQGADGSWTVVYDLAVTNPSADQSSQYDLSDTLQFGAGITVTSATVTGPDGVSVNPDWTGIAPDTSIVAGRIIAPHTQEHYTVTVIASVAATATSTDRDCTLDEGEAGTGLLNQAELTTGNTTSTSTACAAPVSPTITKTVASVTAAGTGRWIVTYAVTVSNPSETTGLVYSLTDRPGFPAEVGISDQQASWVHSLLDGSAATESQAISGWTGMEGGDTLATDQVLPAGSKDTYRVVVTASVPVTVDDELTCSPAGAGHGFFNEATVFSGGDSMTATACADIEPTIEVLPTSSTATPPPPSTTTISVLPTSTSIAYTGVNTSGMGWLAFLLLGAGALLLAVGTLWRRKPRRH
jgi:fimbrial isopeptide formation D2 family protein